MSSVIYSDGKISGYVCEECGGVFRELYGDLCSNCRNVKEQIKRNEKKKSKYAKDSNRRDR